MFKNSDAYIDGMNFENYISVSNYIVITLYYFYYFLFPRNKGKLSQNLNQLSTKIIMKKKKELPSSISIKILYTFHSISQLFIISARFFKKPNFLKKISNANNKKHLARYFSYFLDDL